MKIDKIKTDDSDSLESVDFKQAFLNRITNVYFENFSQEIYKEILLMRLKPIKEYYLKKFNIALNFSDDVIDKQNVQKACSINNAINYLSYVSKKN